MTKHTPSQQRTATPQRNNFSAPLTIASAILTLSYVSAALSAIELPVVVFKPAYIPIAGGDNEARFLCQLEYWTEKLREKRGLAWDGWVFNTVEEWEQQTGLTPSQQKTVKRNLEALDLIEYKRAGRSGVLHYRLNVVMLWSLLNSCKQIGELRQTEKPKSSKSSARIAKPITEETQRISIEIPVPEASPVESSQNESELLTPEQTARIKAQLQDMGAFNNTTLKYALAQPVEALFQLERLRAAIQRNEVRKTRAAWFMDNLKHKRRDGDKKGAPTAPDAPRYVSEADLVAERELRGEKRSEPVATCLTQLLSQTPVGIDADTKPIPKEVFDEEKLERDAACDRVFNELPDEKSSPVREECYHLFRGQGEAIARQRMAHKRAFVWREYREQVEALMQSGRRSEA